MKIFVGDGNAENGFGFIVGQWDQRIFVVTAYHVISGGDNPDLPVPKVKISFFSDQGMRYDTIILEHDTNHDLALLAVSAPQGIAWQKNCLAPLRQETRGTKVWFVGRDGQWYVPVENGFISSERPNPESSLQADMPLLRPGSSGGPLVTDIGIVGMVKASSADDTRVLSIEFIRQAVQDWGYPWDLADSQPLPPTPPDQPCTISVSSTPSGAAISVDQVAGGDTPATIDLSPGRAHDLTVEKDKYEPFSRRVDCQSGHINAVLRKIVGDITVRYTGDYAACSLLLNVIIGDKRFSPTSNLYPIHDVKLGDQDYTIEGRITCPIGTPLAGTCVASGSGSLNVQNGTTYDVIWTPSAYARCNVELH